MVAVVTKSARGIALTDRFVAGNGFAVFGTSDHGGGAAAVKVESLVGTEFFEPFGGLFKGCAHAVCCLAAVNGHKVDITVVLRDAHGGAGVDVFIFLREDFAVFKDDGTTGYGGADVGVFFVFFGHCNGCDVVRGDHEAGIAVLVG